MRFVKCNDNTINDTIETVIVILGTYFNFYKELSHLSL